MCGVGAFFMQIRGGTFSASSGFGVGCCTLEQFAARARRIRVTNGSITRIIMIALILIREAPPQVTLLKLRDHSSG